MEGYQAGNCNRSTTTSRQCQVQDGVKIGIGGKWRRKTEGRRDEGEEKLTKPLLVGSRLATAKRIRCDSIRQSQAHTGVAGVGTLALGPPAPADSLRRPPWVGPWPVLCVPGNQPRQAPPCSPPPCGPSDWPLQLRGPEDPLFLPVVSPKFQNRTLDSQPGCGQRPTCEAPQQGSQASLAHAIAAEVSKGFTHIPLARPETAIDFGSVLPVPSAFPAIQLYRGFPRGELEKMPSGCGGEAELKVGLVSMDKR
ncbi:hypothetical protein JX266_002331 [Neoarthrinium moseri]|nr:hypothetical protein JX266_002331 [Neoarthrinium moseri]